MDDKAALSQRFKLLLKTHTQAEIARKTGHSLSNVNRYASGTRLPGDFCGALVHGLGINPAWLLAGEGVPYVADISAGTQRMAADMLELVEAMSAVAQMRLGALAGKHHLRVLRELNDALARYESLRARLNEQSRPIFRQLMADLQGALKKFDLDRVTDLRKAASQVARLCDDEALARRLLELQAQAEFLARNTEGALTFQRKLVQAQLVATERISDEDCEMIRRYCLTLRGQGRLGEALRVCSAALELARDRDVSEAVHELTFLRGRILVGVGELREGLAQMQAHAPYLGARRKSAAYAALLRAMLMGGLVAPAAGFEFVPGLHEPGSASRASTSEIMLEFACLRADAPLLRRALKFAEDLPAETPSELIPALAWPRAVLKALAHRAQAKEWQLVATELAQRARATGLIDALEAHFHLLRGDRQSAMECHLRAQRNLDATAKNVTLDLLWLAIHHRNALATIAPDERDKQLAVLRNASENWIADHIKRGYAAFGA